MRISEVTSASDVADFSLSNTPSSCADSVSLFRIYSGTNRHPGETRESKKNAWCLWLQDKRIRRWICEIHPARVKCRSADRTSGDASSSALELWRRPRTASVQRTSTSGAAMSPSFLCRGTFLRGPCFSVLFVGNGIVYCRASVFLPSAEFVVVAPLSRAGPDSARTSGRQSARRTAPQPCATTRQSSPR